MNFKSLLEEKQIRSSVPCRVDFGGTLDISTFYLPLAHLEPASFNIALDMRTHVTLSPWTPGKVKVSSRGFEPKEFNKDQVRFDHPMGLMFAIARHFNAHGVHIKINSTSPPKSALGGSSSAAVAIVAAFFSALGKKINPTRITWLAHYIESSVAGVPCGGQDQAAAAFGGVNLWEWKMGEAGPEFKRHPVCDTVEDLNALNDCLAIAYCGIPHVSKDINAQWVNSFIQGKTIAVFEKIVQMTKEFSSALSAKNYSLAGELMARETKLRLEMTPGVLDKTGKKLFEIAGSLNCGARFTGAGGGGCLWALGEKNEITGLKQAWQEALKPVPEGKLLDTRIDLDGIIIL